MASLEELVPKVDLAKKTWRQKAYLLNKTILHTVTPETLTNLTLNVYTPGIKPTTLSDIPRELEKFFDSDNNTENNKIKSLKEILLENKRHHHR